MEKYTPIANMKDFQGQRISLAGWLYRNRPSGKVQFLVLRDGTGLCQCVIELDKIGEDIFEKLKSLGQESSLIISGIVRKEDRSVGGYELAADRAQILCQSVDYPITPKPHGIDFLMKNRHLHLRSRRPWCIAKIRHTVIDAVRRFFNDNGFTLVDTPIFTTIAGEGEQTLFEVDYFGKPLHLAQTGQLYLESAAMSLGRVYCFGPTFRAEKSKTRRHLTEFWMVEPEVAYIDLKGLLELAENFVSFVVGNVLEKNLPQLEEIGADIEHLKKINPPFERLTYTQAVEILTSSRAVDFLANQLIEFKAQREEFEIKLKNLQSQQEQTNKQWQINKIQAEIADLKLEIDELDTKIENNPKHAELATNFRWGKDLGGSDETIISLMHQKPVFVTHYPKEAKAFYMRTDRSNDKVVENFDLLAPAGFGEIIGGSVREDEYDMLIERIKHEGYNPDSYSWYLDLRKYGSVPHGGFGLGIERTVAWITGERHIRNCIAYPRMMDKVDI